jgi:hypothetical protein
MFETGSSITIMHLLTQHCQLDNSWQNINFLPFHNPSLHLTSPLPTFSYSLNSKLLLREDFRQWKTSSPMQLEGNTINILQKVFSKVEKWRRGALLHKGTILRNIIFNKL